MKIALFTAEAFQLGICEKVDVKVPADLDQLGGDDSHGAFVGGKSFIQLGHAAANGRTFFQKMHVIT